MISAMAHDPERHVGADDLLVLVTDDLYDDVARCAAAAGYTVRRATPQTCRREWRAARAVIADAAAVCALDAHPPPRREGLIVVDDGSTDQAVWSRAIRLGASHAVSLPSDDHELVAVLSRLRQPRRHRAPAVAIVGGHGGAGATTLAAAVALAGAGTGSPTVLADVDPGGPGSDLLLGLEDAPGVRWQDLTVERGSISGSALRAAAPCSDEHLAVLAPRRDGVREIRPDTLIAVLEGVREHGDTLIVDLPRSHGELVDAVLDTVDLTILLTTATLAGCASSKTLAPRLAADGRRTELVVRGPSPSGLRARAVAEAIGLPLLHSYRPEPRLPARVERAPLRVAPRSPLGRAAAAVLASAAPVIA